MGLLSKKVSTSTPLIAPKLRAVGVVEVPPHLDRWKKLAPEVQRANADRNAQTDGLLDATAELRGRVLAAAVATAPASQRGDVFLQKAFTVASDLGALTGVFAQSRTDFLVGFVSPIVEIVTFADKNSIARSIKDPVISNVASWCYEAAFYCAQTGVDIDGLVPALHASLASELQRLYGPEVDTRHLT